MSSIFLYCAPSCFLRQNLSLNLKLNISPRLAALRDPLVSTTPQLGFHIHTVMPGFYVGVGDRTQVPMLAHDPTPQACPDF